jgi:hypothetical protein
MVVSTDRQSSHLFELRHTAAGETGCIARADFTAGIDG